MRAAANGTTEGFAQRAWLAWHSLPRGEKGRPPRQAHLEREFGIAQGTLSRLFSGYIKTVEAGTLIKLSRAFQVDATWLTTGDGQPPTPTGVVPPMPGAVYTSPRDGAAPVRFVELDDRYPNRATAAWIARRGGVAEEAIKSVLDDALQAEDDPPELWWLDRMRLRESMLKSQQLPGTPVPPQALPARRERNHKPS